MDKIKNFLLNLVSICIWDVEVNHKNYIEAETDLSEHKYFLTHRAAKKFAKQVNESGNYVTNCYGCVVLWLICPKFIFPKD